MHPAIEARAARLCEALTGIGLQLKHSECVEVLSKPRPGDVNPSDAQSFESRSLKSTWVPASDATEVLSASDCLLLRDV